MKSLNRAEGKIHLNTICTSRSEHRRYIVLSLKSVKTKTKNGLAPEPLYVFRGVVCIRYICYILIVTQWYVIYLADTACAY